ncbi:MAG: hypothetical protein WED05_11050 [Candidatus Atabeyarchaeum deiterrae]
MPQPTSTDAKKSGADKKERRQEKGVSEQMRADHFATKEMRELHDKASNLMRQGNYRQAFDAYVEYGDSASKIKGLIGGEAAILEGARKFEELRYWNEAGNLYAVAANYLNNSGTFSDAADFYLMAAERLAKADDRSMAGFIASCYAAAAHALREIKSTGQSDAALIKGVLVATGDDPREAEASAFKMTKVGDFENASGMFLKAASTYLKGTDELSGLASTVGIGSLAVDVKSVLQHRAGQDFLAAATCLLKSEAKADLVKGYLVKAADEFTNAVFNFTPLFSLGEANKEDSRRYSYDLVMATALRIVLGSTEDIETLKQQLTYANEKPTKELQESKSLTVARLLMEKKKVETVVGDLREIQFGTMEELKDPIIELFLSYKTAGKRARR